MSRTYHQNKHDRWDDGDTTDMSPFPRSRRRRYATPRYLPGSRKRPQRIIATGVRREPPDLDQLMRAIAQAALEHVAVKPDDADNKTGETDSGNDVRDHRESEVRDDEE